MKKVSCATELKIAIVGCGAWGMALAYLLGSQGYRVAVWSESKEAADAVNRGEPHPALPGAQVSDSIRASNSLEMVVSGSNLVVVAVASRFMRETAHKLAQIITESQVVVTATKGIEAGHLLTMSEVIRDELSREGLDNSIVALSGPTHAEEVALGLPTAVVAASGDENAAQLVQKVFSSEVFRVYTCDDIRGVEVCGAAKNVVALASGIAEGLGYGDNARAALVTRGIREIAVLGAALGCKSATFTGLAGLGDLVVTAMSAHSRNFRAGRLLAQGLPADQVEEKIAQVVEGLAVLPALTEVAHSKSVEMPIAEAVSKVVNGLESPQRASVGLMCRPLKSEELLSPVRRVITYGTFDLLHYGHINLLRRAKELGDYLIVALSTDEFNWGEKGKRCYFPYEKRRAMLEAIEFVDLVIPEDGWDQKREDIHRYSVDTFVMGDDWKGEFDFLEEEGAKVVYLSRTPDISTTQIKGDLAAR